MNLRPRASVITDTAEIISGERVQQLAELTITSRRTFEYQRGIAGYARELLVFEQRMDELDGRAIDRLCNARSLFLYTHDFDEFADAVWPRLATPPSILVTHNSDGEVYTRHAEWLDHEGIGVRYWLAQNVTVAHPRLHPVPIGVANSMWPHGNLRSFARAMRRAQRRRRAPGSLFAHFDASTHPARAAASDALRAHFPAQSVDPAPSLPWRRYLRRLGEHQFSACPRGNGIDTHRVWESLYLGAIPVVERTVLSEHWTSCGLPMVLIDDWTEVTPDRLRHEAEVLKPPWTANAVRLSTYRAAVEAAATARASPPRDARAGSEQGGAEPPTRPAE